MAGPDVGAGGGIGGGLVGTVLGGMHLGDLYTRVIRGDKELTNAQRAELLAIPGVARIEPKYSLGGGKSWRLPDIAGMPGSQALVTNEAQAALNWLRLYRQYAGTAPPPPPPPPPPPGQAGMPGAMPFPSVADYLPRVPPLIATDVAAVLRAGVAGIIAAALFWPTEAGRGSDLYRRGPGGVLAVPKPAATPGSRTRGRRGRRARARPRPVAIPKPRAGTPKILSRTVVRAPAQVIEDIQLGRGIEPPLAVPQSAERLPVPRYGTTTRTSAIPGTTPFPTTAPATAAIPAPATPAATSPWAKIGQYVLPFIPGFLAPGTAPRVNFQPLPSLAPQPAPQPLTAFNTAALPYAVPQTRTKECSCARTKRKPKECTNPIVRKRKTTRDGKTFITTTRELKCQASSRKKLR